MNNKHCKVINNNTLKCWTPPMKKEIFYTLIIKNVGVATNTTPPPGTYKFRKGTCITVTNNFSTSWVLDGVFKGLNFSFTVCMDKDHELIASTGG